MANLPKIVQETMLGEALASAYQESDCAVVVSDDDGNILAANTAMADLLGYGLEELTQLKARDVTGRDDLAEIDPIYTRLMNGEQVFGEAVLRRKDGVVGTIKYRAMNGSIGSLPVLVSITHEISTFNPRK